MKAVKVRNPASLDSLEVVDIDAPGEPGPGEVRVKLHASSLNFHDYAVVAGMIPTDDGRIPLSDGAGEVEAVGDAAGDHIGEDAGEGVLGGLGEVLVEGVGQLAQELREEGAEAEGAGEVVTAFGTEDHACALAVELAIRVAGVI